MGFKSVVFTLRDIKRLLEKPVMPGYSKLALGTTYTRLKLLPRTDSTKKRQVRILNYNVNYFDAENLYFLYQEIFLGRIYQPNATTRTPLIIDCGSNIGISILYFKSQYPNAKIIAFEPQPILNQILTENIESNNLQDIEIYQKAISDQTGSIDFFLNESNPGSLNMGLIQRDEKAKSISVETDLLSKYFDGNTRVNLLKLDIEGAEENVLRDLANNDKLQYVDEIVCEYHHHIETGVDRLSQTLQILENAGFGYQLSGYSHNPPNYGCYQDIMVYAFNKATMKSQ